LPSQQNLYQHWRSGKREKTSRKRSIGAPINQSSNSAAVHFFLSSVVAVDDAVPPFCHTLRYLTGDGTPAATGISQRALWAPNSNTRSARGLCLSLACLVAATSTSSVYRFTSFLSSGKCQGVFEASRHRFQARSAAAIFVGNREPAERRD
jgi:hypothetical protein